jgi:aspartyl-tRNA(Asn)/glutamyl-tRNA(Gln) amidotransferase subunit A
MRTLTEQARAVAAGDVSSEELVGDALDALERVQPSTNAFTHVLAHNALAAARSPRPGPLSGVPVAVKELYDIAGIPTTGCCAAYANRIARADSAVVEALRAAGAIIVAKTNQHELACGATTQVSSFGPAFNPWKTGHIPGGSSGGSGAAVAAGVVAMAMGSDTGGSIRIPSSFCGVTGLKPTLGAVSLRGAMPMSPSFDTAGPLAVSAEDCLLVHRVIAGFDPDDPNSRDGRPLDRPETVERLRVAVPRSFLSPIHKETKAAVEDAARILESLGVIVDEIEGPSVEAAWAAAGPLLVAEVADRYRDLWDDDRVSEEIKGFIDFGRSMSGADVAGSAHAMRQVRRDFEWALTAADALLAPCTAFPAPHADTQVLELEGGTLDVHQSGAARCTLPVNAAGLPALAFPVGFSSDGLPLGAQLIGRPWSEEVLCALGAAYQESTEFHLRRP